MEIMGRKVNIFFGALLTFGIISLLRTVILVWNYDLLDFSIFYYAGQSTLHHMNPYTDQRLFTQASYPPVTFFFTLPFSLMPLVFASRLWTTLSVISFLLGLLILNRMINISRYKSIILFTASVVSFPFKFTIGMGQINLILLSVLILSIYFFYRKKLVSSLFLSVAVLLKLFPIILLTGFILNREYAYVKQVITITLVIFLVSWIYFGQSIYVYYIKNILLPLIYIPADSVYYNQSITGFFARVNIPDFISFIIRVVFIVFTSIKVFEKKSDIYSSISIFLTVTVIINSFSWQHHLILLIIPFFFLYIVRLRLRHLFLLIISYSLVTINIKNPSLYDKHLLGPIILSHGFFGTFILWYIQIKYLSIKKLKK